MKQFIVKYFYNSIFKKFNVFERELKEKVIFPERNLNERSDQIEKKERNLKKEESIQREVSTLILDKLNKK